MKGVDSLFVTQFINSVCKQWCWNNDVIETSHFYWTKRFSNHLEHNTLYILETTAMQS